MHARKLNPPQSDSCDMSFVQVCVDVSDMVHIDIFLFQYQLLVDKFTHQRRRTSKFELRDFFGQLLHLLIISIPKSENDQVWPQMLIYTLIKSVKLINPTADGIKYYEGFGSMEFVDLNQIKCVIGQIMDCGRQAIVNCSTSSAQPHVTS